MEIEKNDTLLVKGVMIRDIDLSNMSFKEVSAFERDVLEASDKSGLPEPRDTLADILGAEFEKKYRAIKRVKWLEKLISEVDASIKEEQDYLHELQAELLQVNNEMSRLN